MTVKVLYHHHKLLRKIKMSQTALMRHSEHKLATYKNAAELTSQNIKKIKDHRRSQIIPYVNYPKSFDYVDKLFPKAGVRNAMVYECDRKFLNKFGYRGIGGLYSKVDKVIVIPDNLNFPQKGRIWNKVCANITLDEVLVHELLHFASDSQIKNTKSIQLEEEFAYGNSVGYLRSKGHTDDEIVDNNFLPYLMTIVNKEEITTKVLVKNDISLEQIKAMDVSSFTNLTIKFNREIFYEAKRVAREMGHKIISIYSEK